MTTHLAGADVHHHSLQGQHHRASQSQRAACGPACRARWSETGRVVSVRAGFHET